MISKSVMYVLVFAALLIAFPFVFTGHCHEPAVGENRTGAEVLVIARNTLRGVVSGQMVHYAKYGRYGTSNELVDGSFLDDRFAVDPTYLGDGCWVKIAPDPGGQSFLAISSTPGPVFVAGESGEIFEYGRNEKISHRRLEDITLMLEEVEEQQEMEALNEEALNSIRHVVSGEFAYYASNGRYGTSAELLAEGVISEQRAGDPADLGNGCGVKIKLDPDGQNFLVVCSTMGTIHVAGGSGEIFTFKQDDDIEHPRSDEILLMADEIDEMLYSNACTEKARNTLRLVVSGEYAYYASHGEFGTSNEMAELGFIPKEMADVPADVGDGCWVYIKPDANGQSFLGISTALDTCFVVTETGEIFPYYLTEGIAHYRSEDVLLVLDEIAAAKANVAHSDNGA